MAQEELKVYIMHVELAREVLKQAGYFTENLWHIDDVKDRFECSDNTAQDILKLALTNEYTMEGIHEAIKGVSESLNLKLKDQ